MSKPKGKKPPTTPSPKNGQKRHAGPGNPIRKEIQGLVFLLCAIIFGGSLISYCPADRLFWNTTGPVGQAQNLLGTVGAHVAGALFDSIGFAAFWFPVILFTLSFLAFKRHPLASPFKSILATLTMLASFSAILALQCGAEVAYKGGDMAPGGLLGLHLAGFTERLLNHFGAYASFVTIFIISLMILTHLSLGWLFSRMGLWGLGVIRKVGDIIAKRRERKKRARKTTIARTKLKSKPKVTIVKPGSARPEAPEQEQFPFMNVAGSFKLPPLDFLKDPPKKQNVKVQQESLEMNARRLEKMLSDFGVEGEVVEILPGPVITMYEYKPAPGVKISKVAGLSDDLALTLRAPSIRIVAPIKGKAAIGIEIPNNHREMVYFKEILSSAAYKHTKHKLPIALGKDITGTSMVADLAKMPHLLIAGATGTGKSVSINTMIQSILFKLSPDMVRMLMIDPKRIELSVYQDIPHLLHPVVTQPKDATKALKWAVDEMERRYMLMSDRGVRSIETYNRKMVKEPPPQEEDTSRGIDRTLPYIIVIIDELADLMMVSSKEVEESITRLAQMARAAGIHLIIATQRPSVNVLTGVIKANFPTRLSFQVSSRVDSRTILDSIGAEHLLGEGDMLFMPPGVGQIMRIHGAYLSDDEIKDVTDFLRKQRKPDYDDTILSEIAREDDSAEEDVEHDEKYDEAIDVVAKTGQASISMLQRKLRVGYNRAARMIETMEREGVVGPSDGVRPREVFGRKGE
ncbi:MAG: DNA translocase FtsK [Deltaproteobacteria bacterium]|nr:DNA translocase FtsK [Deltaproteobacteria bacterium]